MHYNRRLQVNMCKKSLLLACRCTCLVFYNLAAFYKLNPWTMLNNNVQIYVISLALDCDEISIAINTA
jgi:hypothetical protein